MESLEYAVVDQEGGGVDLMGVAKALGYQNVRMVPGRGVCGSQEFMFTGGLVYGLHEAGYVGRYCYGTMGEANEALAAWDGIGDPPGAWIKLKGADGERTGPGLAA